MRQRINLILLAILTQLGCLSLNAQELPMDPAIRHGKLSNGLTYYIRNNPNPRNQADFYIVQRVGSILEEEPQRGLAHFLEHMAFNGTKHFPKKNLIHYLEQNGAQFGNNIGAFTSFDHTIYNLSRINVDRWGIVDSCLLILHDWSGCISLEGKEIDAERKVIHEEWRTRANVKDRLYEQTLHDLFPNGNRYAERMPIGLMSVVDHCSHQSLRDYYKKWYRPDLQGIIVVGDVDVDKVEQRIREMWSDITLSPNAAKREYVQVPDNEKPIVAIAHDKEMTTNKFRISYKYDLMPAQVSLSKEGKKINYMNTMAMQMLNNRVQESIREGKAPYLSAQFYDSYFSISQTKKSFTSDAYFKRGAWKQAVEGLVYEIKRAWQYGFSQAELNHLTASMKPSVAMQRNYKGHFANNVYVDKCIAHFLYNQPALATDAECDLYEELIDQTTAQEISQYFQSLVRANNVVLQMEGEERTDYTYPTKEEIVEAYNNAWLQEPAPYQFETMVHEDLIKQLPTAGTIVKSEENATFGTTEWTLSNGAKVILKPTPYSQGGISINAFSEGGTSLFKDEDVHNFNLINQLPAMGGIGNFAPMDLGKMLTGCTASYQTNIGNFTETFTGSATYKDLKTLMELLYLRFTTVRKDTAGFNRWKENKISEITNRLNNPYAVIGDTIRTLLYERNARMPWTSMDMVNKVDYDRVCELFLDRYSNAADFTFIITGDINQEVLRPLVCQYIAALPADKNKKETFNAETNNRLRHGRHQNRVEVPMQSPRTTVIYNIIAKEKYSQKHTISTDLLRLILDLAYTEKVREEAGGSYIVSCSVVLDRIPKNEMSMMINFNTSKERAKEMLNLTLNILKDIAQNGPSQEAFDKSVKYMRKSHYDFMNTNKFWITALTNNVRFGTLELFEYEKDLDAITPKDIQKMAKKFVKSKQTNEIIIDGVKK